MTDNKNKKIVENPELCRKIVFAIHQAVSQDTPQYIRENHLETNNRVIFLVGDCINENLKKYVKSEAVELLHFNRGFWEGCILIDRENKITYTVSKTQTLERIVKTYRSSPHYLQSILYAENGELVGAVKQMSLNDIWPEVVEASFEEDELEDDYDKIMQGRIERTEGYNHYIIAYTSKQRRIETMDILLLDKDFAEVDKVDIMKYVNIDFATLTGISFDGADSISDEEDEVKIVPLTVRTGIKPGVKTTLRAIEEEI